MPGSPTTIIKKPRPAIASSSRSLSWANSFSRATNGLRRAALSGRGGADGAPGTAAVVNGAAASAPKAVTTSSADAGRASGDFASRRSTSVSTPCGT